MEESEVPLEKLAEDIEEAVKHPGSVGWLTWSALLSAFLAVFAAVAALNSGHLANEAMLDQIHASDKWSYYQAKSIKAAILDSQLAMMEQLGRHPLSAETSKLVEYGTEQKELKAKAEEFETEGHHHFELHEIFARAVTLFQIAIAVTAISVLARKRRFLFVAAVFGVGGLVFLVQGFTS